MNKQNIVLTLVVVIAIAISSWAFQPKVEVVVPGELGSVSGPDVFSYLDVRGFLSEGGGKTTATPQNATYTLTAADMARSNLITFSASTTMPALTANLPASTTFPLGQEPGSTRRWVIENPFTASATTTTIGAGTGVDLQEPDGQNVVIGINNYAFVTCIRGADSGAPKDIVCSIDETIPAD